MKWDSFGKTLLADKGTICKSLSFILVTQSCSHQSGRRPRKFSIYPLKHKKKIYVQRSELTTNSVWMTGNTTEVKPNVLSRFVVEKLYCVALDIKCTTQCLMKENSVSKCVDVDCARSRICTKNQCWFLVQTSPPLGKVCTLSVLPFTCAHH